MTTGQLLLLFPAGIAAGLCGSIAGLASLFSYPALLAVGLPATSANVTNTVSLLFQTAGATAGSRPELAGAGPQVRRWAPAAVLGGAAGAGLLLLTPAGGFEKIVPFLVAAAAVLLLVPPRPAVAPPGTGTALGVFGVGIYGGYFGAAAGVLMLALLAALPGTTLLRANALKNVLTGTANGVAAVGFAVFGDVAWAAVPALAAGVLIGAWIGPAAARRLPTRLLRAGIAVAGLGLAVHLFTDAWL